MLVAVGGDQLRQLLDVGAHLQALDWTEKPFEVKVVGLFHHLIEEVVDAQPQGQAAELAKVPGETAGSVVRRFLQEIEESPSIVPRLARPAARLHRVGGVARQAQQAHQADGVVRVVDRAQVGETILDFRLLIETASSADLVGDAAALQRAGEVVEVGIGAEQDGDRIRSMPPFVDRRLGQGGHGVGLLGHAGGGQHTDRPAFAARRRQSFLEAVRIFADQPAGRAEDGAPAPEILLELDHGRIGVHGAEAPEVGDRGAAKLIDALVIVAYHAQVALRSGEQLEQPALGEVGVLELVDHQVGEALALPSGDRWFRGEELDTVVDRVVEVQAFLGEQTRLILRIDERRLPLGRQHRIIAGRASVGVGPRPEFHRRDQFLLGAFD